MSDVESLRSEILELQQRVAEQQDQAGKANLLEKQLRQADKEKRDLEESLRGAHDELKYVSRRYQQLEDAVETKEAIKGSSYGLSTKTVYVTQESRKIPKLKGRPETEGDIEVDEWIDDVRRQIHSRHMTKKEQCSFIMDHLKGAVKSEIRYRVPKEENDPEKILTLIHEVFGHPDTVTHLQEQFYKRAQREGETLHEFSLALMKLLDRVIKKDPSWEKIKDKTMKGKFTEGVLDKHLQRELRKVNIEDPDLPFWEFRDNAIKWIGEKDTKPKSTATVSAVSSPQSQTTTEQLLEMLTKQQAQIDRLLKLTSQKPNNRSSGWNEKGERVCYVCRDPSHIVRDCPKRVVKEQQQPKDKHPSL